jgi:cobalt-precorrin 5A hydrolase/precorrin-3B C17-methyltransferase
VTARGRLAVVGLGPGTPAWRTPEADARLAGATDLVGYGPYLRMVGDLPQRPVVHESDNRQEAARARLALDLASEGRDVVLVSSGDPGVFAMATAVVEELHHDAAGSYADVDVDVVPGITAASGAAARVGAPLGHDFATISLSDVLKPWDVVEARVRAAADADFVLALYNPISRHRPWQLGRALELVGAVRAPDTPVVLGRDVGRDDERVVLTTLGDVDPADVDMRTVVIIGSSTTRAFTHAGGRTWVYTPRTYPGS